MNPIGLYIHIPFCDGKCHYCNFFSVKRDAAAMDEYTENLCRSLREWGNKIDRRVATVYFGGGTPSLLGHERLIAILNTARESFDVEDGAEITAEVNPSSTVHLDFELMRKAGFNRLSVGLQSANDEELRLLGRRHSADDVRRTVEAARKAGFDNISLDVMLAIPSQTVASLDTTLTYCADLQAQHISAYILKIEEGTRFYQERHQLQLFDDEQQAALYEHTVGRLKELGYGQYEISNFAKEGYESRHNLLYWRDEEYLGVGPSAHSFLNGHRFYYDSSFERFYRGEAVDEGSGGDSDEYIMLALRLKEGLSFDRYRARFCADVSNDLISAAKRLQQEGYVTLTSSSLSLTTKGFLVSNAVIGYLLENT